MKTLLLLLLPLLTFSQTRFITSEDFRASKMRGFNLSMVHTLTELKAKDLAGAKATGANHGRYWIRFQHDAANRYTPINSAAFTTLDSAIRQAEKIKLPLVVTAEFLPKQGADDWWGNTARKDSIKKIWVQLATRLKDKKIVAAYDLMNEPRKNSAKVCTVKEYIDFQMSIINAIRKIDTNHVIVVEVLGNSMLGDPYMANIVKIKNIVYSPHGYSYLAITHQGTSATLPTQSYPSTKYPATYFTVNSYWKVMKDFMVKYNVPIWVGEFSCINWSPKNSLGQWTSTRWIEDAIKYMESNGISWAYHAWKEYEGWDPMIPSSYYVGMTFKDGAPYPKPKGADWRAQRTLSAPTMVMLKKYFTKNIPL